MLKKLLIGIVVLGVIAWLSLTAIFLSSEKTSDLVMCSLNKNVVYVPSVVCREYLQYGRDDKHTLKQIEKNGGVKFIISAVPETAAKDAPGEIKNAKILIKHFLSMGIDINQIGQRDGLTALHAAVLMNQPEWVRFLMKNGANPNIKDTNNNLTVLEFAEMLQKKDSAVDRTKIVAMLKSAVNK